MLTPKQFDRFLVNLAQRVDEEEKEYYRASREYSRLLSLGEVATKPEPPECWVTRAEVRSMGSYICYRDEWAQKLTEAATFD